MARFIKKTDALTWDADARKALDQVPVFVRKLARKKVEQEVRKQGGTRVRMEDFNKAREIFRKKSGGSSMEELKGRVPARNEPGVSMVEVLSCHNELSECPWPLIRTAKWVDALESRIKGKGFSEKLRKRIKGKKILYHQKIKIAVSGCPNGCSRPQIADFGIMGRARPVFDLKECTGCGECAANCPDQALAMVNDLPQWNQDACQGCLGCSRACGMGCVSLKNVGVRLLAGGRLGRHPRLAQTIGEYESVEPVFSIIDRALTDYSGQDEIGQRFADFVHQSLINRTTH